MVIATRYKIKPLVLFSDSNIKDDTAKSIKHAQTQQYQRLANILKS